MSTELDAAGGGARDEIWLLRRVAFRSIVLHRSQIEFDQSMRSSHLYLGFGGGGLGTPVVSYAPLPILQDWTSIEIIMKAFEGC